MIDRTITTYTFLDSLRESGIKQLDLYIPLVCKSIVKHSSKTVSRDDLKQWFKIDYGMSKVYQGVFDTLLKRMKGEFLILDNGTYSVNMPAVISEVGKHKEKDISEEFSSLLQSIKSFSKDKYGIDLTLEEVQDGVLNLLHSRDGELLFQQEKAVEILSKQKEGKTPKAQLKYILSQYVIWSKDNQNSSFSLIAKLAKGHVLASIVSMKDVASYTGKMKGVSIALDTPIIFNLLNLNYETNLELDKELLSVLQKQGTDIILFQEHYQEIKQSINTAIHLLTTKKYNIDKTSRLIRYAIKNHISPHYLRTKLQQLDSVLEKYHITVVGAPPSQSGYQEIDFHKLEDLLIMRYSEGNPDSLDEIKRKIINTDVDVVSYVYRMRGHNVATNLKNCNAILVTTNTALAYASKHPDVSIISHAIPACLTDVLLSTTLWFNYPDVNEKVNEKVLISECYKNVTLPDEIIQRFYKDVERINAESPLTEEQMLDANTSEIVMDLLENKTFNDETLYTDMTAAEILDECERKRTKDLNEKSDKLSHIDDNTHKRSKIIGTILYTIIWLILVVLFVFLKYVDYSSWKGWNIFFNVLSLLPALWGLLSWNGCIWPKANVINRLSNWVYSVLYKDLDK